VQITPELLTAFAGVIGAAGVFVKQIRDSRRERRERRKTERVVEKVARAAARHSSSVRDVVDELEQTGSFQRPTKPDDGGEG
jgi:hypothetical protein